MAVNGPHDGCFSLVYTGFSPCGTRGDHQSPTLFGYIWKNPTLLCLLFEDGSEAPGDGSVGIGQDQSGLVGIDRDWCALMQPQYGRFFASDCARLLLTWGGIIG